jgi:hypothetical protein
MIVEFICTSVKAKADHSGCVVKGMNCLRSHEPGILGSNPIQGMVVCVYSVFMLSRVWVGAL